MRKKIGARTLGPKKTETFTGRAQNKQSKAAFKAGPHAKQTKKEKNT